MMLFATKVIFQVASKMGTELWRVELPLNVSQ
jgi:hypothetical protein